MSRGTYGPLSPAIGSDDEIELTAPAPSSDTAASFNMNAASSNKSGPSTPNNGRSNSKPRRGSPLSQPYLGPNDIQANYLRGDSRAGPSNSKEPWTAEVNLDALSLEIDDSKRIRLQHEFDANKQFWRLFWSGFKRFFITLTLVIFLVVTIWWFSRRRVMSNRKKRWFNAISTGLSLALGISIASGFKAMTKDFRWWILSRRKRSLSEVDKILRSDSLTTLLELLGSTLWRTIRHNPLKLRWGLIAACMAWLSINIAAQVALAMVALNYSAEVDQTTALTIPGHVLLPNMSQIFPVGFGTEARDSIGAQQYTANSYGNMALSFQPDYTSNIPEPLSFFSTGADFFQGDDSWVFVFLDSPPAGISLNSVYTNRTINSTWSCQSWPVTGGGYGNVSSLTVLKDSNGNTFNVELPTVGGPDQTTFFAAPNETCGSGCSVVEAFEASSKRPWYYSCNITAGTVNNGTIPEHQVGIRLRQMASSGIALQGYGLTSSLPGAKQFQVYPSESSYGAPQDGSTDNMGSLIGMFAIGVVTAAAVYTNVTFMVPGEQPSIGNQLTVSEWKFIWLILALILGVQGIFFVMTAFLANRVVVKDESMLSTARLLRPILESLGDSGNAADGEAICEVLGNGPETRVIYTVLKDGKDDELFHLELGNHRSCRAFPEGRYD